MRSGNKTTKQVEWSDICTSYKHLGICTDWFIQCIAHNFLYNNIYNVYSMIFRLMKNIESLKFNIKPFHSVFSSVTHYRCHVHHTSCQEMSPFSQLGAHHHFRQKNSPLRRETHLGRQGWQNVTREWAISKYSKSIKLPIAYYNYCESPEQTWVFQCAIFRS